MQNLSVARDRSIRQNQITSPYGLLIHNPFWHRPTTPEKWESKMKAALVVAMAGVILGWLLLQYALERSAVMQPLWTADIWLLVFLCFALFSVFIYAIVKLAGRRY
jgi:hypothetical protein